MFGWRVIDRFLPILGILSGLLLMQACSRQLPEESACNFVRNSQAQRVSWNQTGVLNLYIDGSVDASLVPFVESAVKEWNQNVGRDVIKVISGVVKGSSTPTKDGVSKIYMLNTWDPNRPDEQARTTVHWVGTQMQEADIRINAHDFEFYTGFHPANASQIHFQSLVLHEIGHALGLAHNESATSVMQTKLAQSTIRDEVGSADLASLSCEYK